jgi:hypothetical protein
METLFPLVTSTLETSPSSFPAFESFPLLARFGFFWRRWLLVFLVDFLDTLVYFFFEEIADVVFVSESVGACGYGEFSCYDTRDFSALPAFGVVEQGMLED